MKEYEIRAIKLFKALNNTSRYKILKFLKKGKKSFAEILLELQKSKPTVSKHLNLLKNLDLIMYHYENKQIFYEMKNEYINNFIDDLEKKLKREKF